MCPKCSSDDYRVMGKMFFFLLFLILFSFSMIFALITAFGTISVFALVFCGVMMIVSLFFPAMQSCKRCNHAWVKKKELAS